MFGTIVAVLKAEQERRQQWEAEFVILLRQHLGGSPTSVNPLDIPGQITIQQGIEEALKEKSLTSDPTASPSTEVLNKPNETSTPSSRRVKKKTSKFDQFADVLGLPKEEPVGSITDGAVPELEENEELFEDDVRVRKCEICRKKHRVDQLC